MKNGGFSRKNDENSRFLALNRLYSIVLGGARVDTQKLITSINSGGDHMTETQKEQIRAMRMQGIGYRLIAKELGLKINQVQLFCKAHGLSGPAEIAVLNYPVWCEQNGRCPVCGSKISQPKTGRRKKFCSGRCRTRYCLMKKQTEE